MSKWTHSICAECWGKKNPDRQPVKTIDGPREVCCFCGQSHASGIFIRHNPEELRCEGKHE